MATIMTSDVNLQAQLPEGFVLDNSPQVPPLPEGFTIDPIDQPLPKEPQDGFLQRTGQALSERISEIEEIQQAKSQGEIGAVRSGFQQAGQAAGGLIDVGGEALESGLRALPDSAERIIRNILSAPIEALSGLPSLDPDAPTMGEFISREISNLKESDPNLARDLESTLNIGALVLPTKGKVGKTTDAVTDTLASGAPSASRAVATGVGKTADVIGEKLVQSGTKQATQKNRSFLEGLVREKETQSVRAGQIASGRRTQSGILGGQKVTATDFESRMADAVSEVKNVSPRSSLIKNTTRILDEARETNNQLVKSLEDLNIAIPKAEYKAALKGAVERIMDEPIIVGSAKKPTEALIRKIDRLLDDVAGTPAGILELRKKIDNEIIKAKPKAFDANIENAFNIVTREIRETTNDFIAKKAPSVEVRDLLDKQHLLLSAAENTAAKAAAQGQNVLSRLWQKTGALTSLKGDIIAAGALAGGGATALSGAAIPVALGAGGTVYLGGKLLTSAKTKKLLGATIKGIDKALKKEKDAELLKRLRADRIIVMDLLEQQEEENE